MSPSDDAGTALSIRKPDASIADPGDRGVTTLADKVLEKVTARAALEVPRATGLSRSIAGRSFGSQAVRSEIERDGDTASVRLEIAVDYPASARDTTRAVRHHVRERIETLCGITVEHIDIVVAVLRRPSTDGRRVQ